VGWKNRIILLNSHVINPDRLVRRPDVLSLLDANFINRVYIYVRVVINGCECEIDVVRCGVRSEYEVHTVLLAGRRYEGDAICQRAEPD
jgi:hypothetical protein